MPVTKAAASFEYDFFQLPEISPAMLTHSVEVRVRASFSSDGYGEWAAARPELLLLKARPPDSHLFNYTCSSHLGPIKCLTVRVSARHHTPNIHREIHGDMHKIILPEELTAQC